MAKTILVGPDLELGERILHFLDRAKFPVSVALWIMMDEEDRNWTLLISTPIYDQEGQGEAYSQLVTALQSTEYTLGQLPIRLESNRKPLVKALRKIFGKTASVHGMRLGGHMIGGVWVDDAYVYRIK